MMFTIRTVKEFREAVDTLLLQAREQTAEHAKNTRTYRFATGQIHALLTVLEMLASLEKHSTQEPTQEATEEPVRSFRYRLVTCDTGSLRSGHMGRNTETIFSDREAAERAYAEAVEIDNGVVELWEERCVRHN
jgi:6-phosphofructokinase